MFCHICEKETGIKKANIFYGHHVRKTHSISSQEYYDRFFKKEYEGKCKICAISVNFINVSKGYQQYCSRKCQFKDDELRKRQQETCIQKYGNKSPLANKEIIRKSKKTIKEKYGVDFISQNKEIKSKATNTFKDNYGIGSDGHKEIQEKRNSTLIEKYGSINPEIFTENRIQNNLEKYGVEHTFQIPEVREKIKKTNLERYGTTNPLESEVIRNKIEETNLQRYGSIYPKLSKERKRELIKDKIFKQINENLPEGYSLIEFIPKEYYKFKCSLNHEFELFQYTLINNRKKRNQEICPICNPQERFCSQFEKEIKEFIQFHYNEKILLADRSLIKPYELDIYIPELKLAFEFNGLFWHCEMMKPKNYHKMKTEFCESKGIHLIHIYEDDWIYKKEIVKSRILNLLKKISNRIYARKCFVREVDYESSKVFLEENHIQGNSISKIRYGLYYNNELVSLMTFGNLRKNLGQIHKEGVYELTRFCNKLNTNVIGGSSKLLAYFLENNKFKRLISYADRSWSQGNLYKKLGFEFVKNTEPNYQYVIKDKRYNRFIFRKDILVSQGFDECKSEHEIMLDRKIYRIYDSGSILFQKEYKYM